MLILVREHKQKILIGDDIIITVFIPDTLTYKKSKRKHAGTYLTIPGVHIGIDAPKNIKVFREELVNKNE